MLKVVISGKDHLVVRLAGKINEAADLHMVSVPAKDAIEVDMIDVTHINSVGIRQLRDWTQTLKAQMLTFSYCPRVIIDQLNMVVDLIPKHSRIMSFYVPFYSEATGEEKNVLLVRGEHFHVDGHPGKIVLPPAVDSAGAEMEVDVLADKYFKFLSQF